MCCVHHFRNVSFWFVASEDEVDSAEDGRVLGHRGLCSQGVQGGWTACVLPWIHSQCNRNHSIRWN